MNAPNQSQARHHRDLIPKSIELLSEISRDPAVHGEEVAAMALGSLAYFAIPDAVVGANGPDTRPSGTLVTLAVLSQLAPEQTAGLGAPELFRYARKEALPFVEAARDRLMRAGQMFVVGMILEKANREVPRATRELEPIIEKLRSGVNMMEEPKPDFGKTLVGVSPVPKKALLEPNEYHIGETDATLSNDERHFLKGMHVNPKYPLTLEELTSPWMLRDDYFSAMVEWAENLKRTLSPNLARVHGLLKKDSRVFLVYDALDGTPLSEIIGQGPMEEGETIEHLEKIMEGLKALHREKVVVKGLRPDRILVDRQGNLKLFSYPPPKTKSLTGKGGDEETLREKGLKGEVRYLAPEICLGTETPNPAADIYSAGLIACEMMLGEANLQQIAGEHVKFWLNWHVDLYKKAVPLSDIDPAISDDFTAIIGRMLEKRMKNRYQDTSEVITDIQALRSGRRLPGKRKTTARKGPSPSKQIAAANARAAEEAGPTKLRQALVVGGAAMVAFMMTLVVIMIIPSGQPSGGEINPNPAGDPAREIIEQATQMNRNEDFDKAQSKLGELSKFKLDPSSESAVDNLKTRIKEAREFKALYKQRYEDGKKAKANGDLGKASQACDEAKEAFKKLSASIERPERTLPDELSKLCQTSEGGDLLEQARSFFKSCKFDLAKQKVQLCLNMYPSSAIATEAASLETKIKDAIIKQKAYEDSFQKGRAAEGSGRSADAALEFTKARQAALEIGKLSDCDSYRTPPQELLDKLTSVYGSLWSIKAPTEGQRVIGVELVLEISVPQRYFEKVEFLGKSVALHDDYLTVKIPNFKSGPYTIEVKAIGRDGLVSAQKVSFTFQQPVIEETRPEIDVYSIAQEGTNIVAQIGYNNERYTVQKNWPSPDQNFTVSDIVLNKGIEVTMTRTKTKFSYSY